MDAIKLLEQDHQETKTAVEEIGWSSAAKKKPLFQALRRGLEIHDTIAKNIFYPWLKSKPKTLKFAKRDGAAQAAMGKSMERLQALPGEDKAWIPAFNVLRGSLLRQQLEESVCFKKVRELLSVDELHEVGHQMVTERERLIKSYGPVSV